jgi:mRNA-degrading endonuclease RelE of RelBE toxin-antitoxin system
MNYRVDTTENFEKEAKRLFKKYRSLKEEIYQLIEELEKNPKKGTHLGDEIYKIRLAVSSKGKGKRGGARIITKVKIVNERVYLISIYNKGEKNDISDKEIQRIIKGI